MSCPKIGLHILGQDRGLELISIYNTSNTLFYFLFFKLGHYIFEKEYIKQFYGYKNFSYNIIDHIECTYFE